MTIAHKNLTGTDLHEIKGASTATQYQVPRADGAGSSPFALLDHNSLTATGNPFGGQLLHVNETQANGVSSVSPLTFGSVLTVTALNTVVTNEISGASIGSNLINLPAGTYYIDAMVPWQAASNGVVEQFSTRLYNVTAAAVQLYGTACKLFGASNNATLYSHIRGRFTIGVNSQFSLQHYKTLGQIGSVSGYQTEIYAQVSIWKVA